MSANMDGLEATARAEYAGACAAQRVVDELQCREMRERDTAAFMKLLSGLGIGADLTVPRLTVGSVTLSYARAVSSAMYGYQPERVQAGWHCPKCHEGKGNITVNARADIGYALEQADAHICGPISGDVREFGCSMCGTEPDPYPAEMKPAATSRDRLIAALREYICDVVREERP